MSEECFHCAAPASREYALVLASGPILPDRPLCAACARRFRAEDRVELVEGPVLVRGNESRVKECPECGREIPIRHWPRHLGTCSGASEAHTPTTEEQ